MSDSPPDRPRRPDCSCSSVRNSSRRSGFGAPAGEVEQQARIDVAAAASHEKARVGRESHRRIDAAAVLDRGHRRAVAEVRDDGPAELRRRRRCARRACSSAREIRSAGCPRPTARRQRQPLGDLGHGAVKRRIEAADLRDVAASVWPPRPPRPAQPAGAAAPRRSAAPARRAPQASAAAGRRSRPPWTNRWPIASRRRQARRPRAHRRRRPAGRRRPARSSRSPSHSTISWPSDSRGMRSRARLRGG